MLQECGRKLWPSSRQSTYQGCGNLAQLTLPHLEDQEGLNMIESWRVQPPATSNHQTPHGARKAPLGHHDEGWKGFGKDDLLSRLRCAFTNSWSQQRRSDTQLGWGLITDHWHCFMIILHGMYSEYACCMFVFSYLAQTFCLFGMALI